MQAGSMVRTFSRFATRQVLLAVIAVAAAMIALALLAEAMNGGGGTVYLAEIDAGRQPAGLPNLVAVGYGTATVPAETALLQLLVSNSSQFNGGYVAPPTPEATPGALEQEAAEPVIAAIQGAGVSGDAVHLVISSVRGNGYYGPPDAVTFRIDVTLSQPNLETVNGIVNAAAQAAAEDGYSLMAIGALFGVADCTAVRNQAWDAAVADARASAQHQAELLGVKLGDLLLSQEALSDPIGRPSTDGISAACAETESSDSLSPYNPYIELDITVPRFEPNAEPVASVSTRVSLAFEILRD